MKLFSGKSLTALLLTIPLLAGSQPAYADEIYAAFADAAAGVRQVVSLEEAAEQVDKSWESDAYFSEAEIHTDTGEVLRDGKKSGLQEIFGVSGGVEKKLLSGNSSENERALTEYLEKRGIYVFHREKHVITVLAPYQLKRVIVHTEGEPLGGTFGAKTASYDSGVRDYILEYDTPEETKQASEKLEKVFGRDRVSLDQLVSVMEEGSCLSSESDVQTPEYVSWGTHFMGLDTVRDAADRDPQLTQTVEVAVLDTGAYGSHEMLKGRIDTKNSRNFLNCWSKGKKPSRKWSDNSAIRGKLGHGTHISGIIADGTSRQVKLLELKVVDQNGNGSLYDIGLAIRYAIKKKAKVINISAGVPLYSWYKKNPQYKYLEPILKKAYKSGVFISCAAGNDGRNLGTIHIYPASSSYVTAVGAINQNTKVADFSNYGKALDFVAPGVNIKSANRFSKSSYIMANGTSMASPHIAAAAAMIYLYNPDGTAKIVRQVLRRQSESGENGKKRSRYGYGYVILSSPQHLLQ